MADAFRMPMDVTYAIAGGEPALMAYRRWRNLSRDGGEIPGDELSALLLAHPVLRQTGSPDPSA